MNATLRSLQKLSRFRYKFAFFQNSTELISSVPLSLQKQRFPNLPSIRNFCSANQSTKEGIGQITPKLAITFTCKVCSTRQGPKQFSRTAYEQGVVLRLGRQEEYRTNFGGERGGGHQTNEYGGDSGQRIATGGQQMPSGGGGGAADPLLVGITELQRALLGVGSAVISLVDPKRGDMIATMGETTVEYRKKYLMDFFPPFSVPNSLLKHLRDRMCRDVSGAELLNTRPRINNKTIDRLWLASLPDGTMGKEYSRFLEGLSTSPDARPPVQFVDDDLELVYVMQRYRETHDLTHVLLQMRPNMLGEVTVKYFEAVQLGFPMCIAAAIFGALRLGPIHRRQLIEQNIPWAVQQAERGRFLLALDWESRFEQTIADLQSECSIQPFARRSN
uniref:Ubiquinone biosynthesis protein COQ4 homolog, mitochondrial n=1 Tax=Globodera rostochiensis TaxID=31243 RepID=A0A914HQC9_GLORO